MKTLITVAFWVITTSLNAQSISLGLIADCQFCNCPYSEKWNNNYSKSSFRLQQAVDTFNTKNVNFTFHLGDFIDREYTSYEIVTPIFNSLKMPHYHVLGNHDFSVEDTLKSKVPKRLNMSKLYSSMEIQNWRLILLDGTDISPYSSMDSCKIAYSDSLMNQYKKEGRIQAKPWNGAIGRNQLLWLESELNQADKLKRDVLILCHFPIYPGGTANLWNDIEVIQLIEKHRSVKAFINGHHHPGNYAIKNGIHYLTLQGMVGSLNQNSFCIGLLKQSQIEIIGYGREPNRILKF